MNFLGELSGKNIEHEVKLNSSLKSTNLALFRFKVGRGQGWAELGLVTRAREFSACGSGSRPESQDLKRAGRLRLGNFQIPASPEVPTRPTPSGWSFKTLAVGQESSACYKSNDLQSFDFSDFSLNLIIELSSMNVKKVDL